MSGIEGGSRVSIPTDLRKTIQSIREITGKQHSDEDIHAVLRDCFFDPHETAQKLLYLDTFHEVKRKRDRKKENSLANTQERGTDGRRNRYLNYKSSDASNGRYAAFRMEHGADYSKKSSKSTLPAPWKDRNNVLQRARKVPYGPSGFPNGFASYEHKDRALNAVNKLGSEPKAWALAQDSSSSQAAGPYPVKAPGVSQHPGAHGTIKPEMGARPEVAEPEHTEKIRQNSQDIHSGMSTGAEKNQLTGIQLSAKNQNGLLGVTSNRGSHSVEVVEKKVATSMSKANSQLFPESDVADCLHLPCSLDSRVAEALKSGLTFGSFDSSLVIGLKRANDGDDSKSPCAESFGTEEKTGESSPMGDDTIVDPSFSGSESTTMPGDNHNMSLPAQVPRSHGNLPTDEHLKGEHLNQMAPSISENYQIPSFPNIPNYGFGSMPPRPTDGIAELEKNAVQIGSSGALASSNPAPTGQNSIAASQQLVSLLQQPYPPNFFSYGPYPPPYLPPNLHQLSTLNGLLQQAYFPPGAATGFKPPFSQLKPEANAGNPVHFGVPSMYASYGSSSGALNHSQASGSVNSTSNTDILATQSKESIYTTGPLNENLLPWMLAHGQGLSSLQVNPLYNIPLQGQPIQFSAMQAAQGGYGGMFQLAQTMAAPPLTNQALHPWLQQPKQ